MIMEQEVRPISTSPCAAGSHDATVPDGGEPIYVTTLQPADVLLGRGAPIIGYEGNVKFRDLVRSRKPAYVSTGQHQAKDEIARDIVREIGRNHGRFLKKVSSPEEREAQRKGREDPLWKVAEDSVAMEKVKQALRDKERIKSDRSLVPPDEVSTGFPGPQNGPQGALGFSSMPGLMNPLGSLLPSHPFALSDMGLLGGPGMFRTTGMLGSGDHWNDLNMLRRQGQYQEELRLQQLRLQMLQNEQMGSMRQQEQLRLLLRLQSTGLPQGLTSDPSLESAADAMQASLSNTNNNTNNSTRSFLPQGVLSNTDRAFLIQQQRLEQMRALSAATSTHPDASQDIMATVGSLSTADALGASFLSAPPIASMLPATYKQPQRADPAETAAVDGSVSGDDLELKLRSIAQANAAQNESGSSGGSSPSGSLSSRDDDDGGKPPATKRPRTSPDGS